VGQIASILKGVVTPNMAYADRILTGITPEQFRRMPDGINTNSPAFNFGHLSIYPDRLLALLGREDLVKADPKWEEMFNAKAVCKDDPNGTIYPPMEQIVARFKDRHNVLMEVIAETKDEVFAKPNPSEASASRFPTIGILVAFLLTSHIMMHMGQTSTWRRVMGLPPAM